MADAMLDADFLARGRKRLNIGVAIDGSQMSDRALAAAACFYDAKRGDVLLLLHVADASKASYLPRHLLPHNLRSAYESKAFELKVGGGARCSVAGGWRCMGPRQPSPPRSQARVPLQAGAGAD
jgi:hypothetical protein